MADKKIEKTGSPDKKDNGSKKSSKNKKGNVFKRMWARIVKFFREYRSEVKKVIWPSFRTVVKNSVVVLVIVVVMGALIGLVDMGLGGIVNLFSLS